jgi:hypothetical protein
MLKSFIIIKKNIKYKDEKIEYMKISKKNSIFVISLFFFLILSISATNVQAHSPSITNLEYDTSAGTLSVSFSHSVGGDPDHYVELVQISVNGTEILSETYTSQPGDTFQYTYNIDANTGATIQVSAFCSISGSDTQTMTVGDTTDPNGGGDDDGGQNGETTIPGYLGIGLISIVSILTIVLVPTLKKVSQK